MIDRTRLVRVLALAIAGLGIRTAHGDILEVPGEFATIQAAIDAALDGDTVLVAPGEYVENLDLLGKAITVTGHDPGDPIVVARTRLRREFGPSAVTFATGETADTVLAGFTIARSFIGGSGGGIAVLGAAPRIEHCRIEQCRGVSGGGAVFVDGGNPAFIACTFHDNESSHGAGMLLDNGALVTVTGCVFRGNRGFKGAGIRIRSGSSAIIDGCEFSANEVHGDGAALNIDSGCSATIGDTYFCGNLPSAIVGDFTDAGGNLFEDICAPSAVSVPFDAPTVQLGILLAMNGEEVVVEPGVYDEAIDMTGREIVLRSTDPTDPAIVAATVIDATGLDAPAVTCALDETEFTVVSGLTFTGGSGTAPPGESLASGGGAFVVRGPGGTLPQPWFEACRFVGNAVEGGGGGAYVENKVRPTFVDCLFADNVAGTDGGGLFVLDHETGAHVIGSTFESNVAGDRGGAMFVWGEDMDVIVDACTFRENVAHAGGAIVLIDPDLSAPVPVSASSFCGNRPDDIVGLWTDVGGNVFDPFCDGIGEGKTILVPDDEATIGDAVASAADGDTVLVRPGTYVGSVNLAGKAITLAGLGGTGASEDPRPVIDAGGSGSAIICNNEETQATIIRDLIVRGGVGTPDSTGEVTGGGIHITSASPRIENVLFLDNIGAEDGAGFSVDGGSPTVRDCVFVGNFANDDGGGAAIRGAGQVSFIDCIFTRNSCGDDGGGIRVHDSFVTVQGCLFELGQAGGFGGAIAAPTVEGIVGVGDSQFCQNSPDDISGPFEDNGGNDFGGNCDTDGDGLLDSWEIAGIPYIDAAGQEQLFLLDWDQDLEIDADPYKKDIFVEVDAMGGTGIAPILADLQPVINAFARAPVENPGGSSPGVNLHIQISDTNLPLQPFPNVWTEFDALKDQWYGTSADLEGEPETVAARLGAKKFAYRYCIFALNHGSDGSSGKAELPGNDFMVTIGDWTPPGGTSRQKAATFMHELGHTLGLTHKGPKSQLSDAELAGPDKHYNLKPNYYSIMNYEWQMPKSWHTTGSHPLASLNSGYSSVPLRALDETDLIETDGLVPISAASTYPEPGFKVRHNVEADPAQPPVVKYTLLRVGGAVDWNGDGVEDDPLDPIARDANHVRTSSFWTPSPDTTLQGHADWPYLVYDFAGLPTFAEGEHGESEEEITFQEYLADETGTPPNCDGDISFDGVVDIVDLLEMLAAWGPCTSGVVCVQDLDENGTVAVNDLLILLAAWGPCP